VDQHGVVITVTSNGNSGRIGVRVIGKRSAGGRLFGRCRPADAVGWNRSRGPVVLPLRVCVRVGTKGAAGGSLCGDRYSKKPKCCLDCYSVLVIISKGVSYE
jgi:hypothetical protein